MEDLVYYSELYDLYGGLLTDTQKKYFEDYYFNNLSFSEMAENYNVSRNAIFRQIHIVIDKLKMYEEVLKLKSKKEEIHKIIKDVDKDIKDRIEEIL